MSNASAQLPIAAISFVRVDDFESWKPKFDATTHVRKAAGILGHHIDRGVDDPNLVCTFFPASDRDKLAAFFADPQLAPRLAALGVTMVGHELVVPQEDHTVRGSGYASGILSHDVEDYARWKAAFDARAEARRRVSIVGHAVCRSLDRPNRVHVYAQAESADQLHAFLRSDATREAWRRSGVQGTPEIKLLTDTGLWAQY